MPYLLSVSIGPVQEFIASARRSRDLWFGSWLLSELSRTAALTIIEDQNQYIERLIFPAPKDIEELWEKDFSVVNKILAIVDSPESVGKAIKEAMENRLLDIAKETFKNKVKENFDQEKAIEQIKDLIEYFWAAYPFDQPEFYATARAQAEALLAARKATRDFQPVNWGSNDPKSSLDGQRESVIPEKAYPPKKIAAKCRRTVLQTLRQTYGVRDGERLCGVGLLKRHGNRGGDDRFFSTSHVASLPFIDGLINLDAEKNKQAFNEYIHKLKDILGELAKTEIRDCVPGEPHKILSRYDGHILFEERLSEFFYKDVEEDKERESAVKTALKEFLELAAKGKRPTPYYALLLADGDRMGKAIDKQDSAESHREISHKLAEFAKSVNGMVRENRGWLVYSGGDDVLAFLPLHTAIQCARQMANTFKKMLCGFSTGEKDSNGIERTPTLSVGIAVAHHLEPLSDTLALVRGAEKAAKSVEGKNALAVAVSKRSGTDRTVKGAWGKLDERLMKFICLHINEDIPDGAGYELRNLALQLSVKKDDDHYLTLERAKKLEAIRILKRKRAKSGSSSMDAEIVKDLAALINLEQAEVSIEQLADELIVARTFSDAMKQANIKVEDLHQQIEHKEE